MSDFGNEEIILDYPSGPKSLRSLNREEGSRRIRVSGGDVMMKQRSESERDLQMLHHLQIAVKREAKSQGEKER